MAAGNHDIRRVLDDEGNVLSGAKVPEIPENDLVKMFDVMLLVRIMDDRMMRLQRQGRLGFYMKSVGEEASHFSVYPLRTSDWVFPSYREQGAWFWRGYTVEQYINQLYGNEKDPVKGRQMPVHHSDREHNLVSISSPVGTQIPQATGAAYAARVQKTGDVAMVFFGEGTTSTGDFHVGMNFAGVLKAPVVFICRNNGWAISVPLSRQTAAKTFASKAVGYGMPGVLVDGNDILAVIQVATEAVERARAGDGPTLIEARTYRVQGHSSSDDPSVYRDPNEPAEWELKDPLKRFRNYLKSTGVWSEKLESELSTRHNDEITRVLEASESLSPPPVASIFDDVYETMPWNLVEQRQYLLAQERVKSPHRH
jgi:2-oxoisovalerate dehydrogenase E1 component alpha subunit